MSLVTATPGVYAQAFCRPSSMHARDGLSTVTSHQHRFRTTDHHHHPRWLSLLLWARGLRSQGEMAGEAGGQPGFLLGQRARSAGGRHFFESCCPRGCGRRVSASFGRADPHPSEPHLYRAMRRTLLHSSRARVGSWMVRAGGQEAVGVSVEVFRFFSRAGVGPTTFLKQNPEAHHIGSLVWVWWRRSPT